MHKARIIRVPLLTIAALLSACFLIPDARHCVQAQQSNASNASALYQAAQERFDKKNYSKALEEVEAALKLDPGFAPALLLKSRVLTMLFIRKYDIVKALKYQEQPFALLKEAADSLDQYLKLTTNAVNASALNEQLETLRAYAQLVNREDPARTLFGPKEVTTKARILSKRPEPTSPDFRIITTVVLLAVLASDGQVKYIITLRAPNDEFAKACVDVARQTNFSPAIKDGRAVSAIVQIEYRFSGRGW